MADTSSPANGITGIQEQLIATLLQSLVPANALNSKKRNKDEPAPLNLATLTVRRTVRPSLYVITKALRQIFASSRVAWA